MKRFVIALFILIVCMRINSTCKDVERNALLKFKHSFYFDQFNDLGSWVGDDYCKWKGVGCDNVTNTVIKLDLSSFSYRDSSIYEYGPSLGAREVSPALLKLKYLKYLDLSGISFDCSRFPEFFGSMKQLQHLNLSYTMLSGKLPHNLGNLTNLVVLDLNFGSSSDSNLEWALKLESLQYLDLSGIDLSQALDSLDILHNLSSLLVLNLASCQLENTHLATKSSSVFPNTLQRLDLSENYFSGPFPHSIQNLSSLRFLNLSMNVFSSSLPSWLENHVHLTYVDLGGNSFDGSFPSFIQNLSSLTFLDLSRNRFSSSLPSWLENHVNLTHVDLGWNSFNGSFPSFIQNLSSISFLDLRENQLTSSIPQWLANKTNLEYLSLGSNYFHRVDGGFINTISHLYSLKFLDMSYNQLQEEVSYSHVNFSRCMTYDLEVLSLRSNKFSGYLPITETFSSLKYLDLSNNSFEIIPSSLGSLSSLIHLDLQNNHIKFVPPLTGNVSSLTFLDLSHNNLVNIPSFLGRLSSLTFLGLKNNSLSVVNQVSLDNLSSLIYLDLSLNSLILDFSSDWLPPFQLKTLELLPCKINGPFPKWILSQEDITELDLSNTGIFGPLPSNIGKVMPSLLSLRLANNHINGSIPRSLCELASLNFLNLKKNSLSGTIPDCWTYSSIFEMELSSNKLYGDIPNSLAIVGTLQLLSLNSNSLQGKLPLSLSNCVRLMVLDVGRNNLHGKIPIWSGAIFPSLQVLRLRENRFEGIIPSQICSIQTLQVFDLANNKLGGTIPQCFGSLKGMSSVDQSSHFTKPPPSPMFATEYASLVEAPNVDTNEWSAMEVIKGEEREYTTVLHLLVNMDLSCNNLVGVIPAEITTSTRLLGLNFSHNHLNGTIPKEIGRMQSLESFDLSCNSISGSIPESISSLTSLSTMNLSFNNLQGKIPTSTQLSTFNDSSYTGNPGLCGDPLPKKCFGDDIAPPQTSKILDDEDNKHEKMWFYLAIISGFATGFWAVIGSLVVLTRWRHAC